MFTTQVPDYKALVGDASDNIPGVSGVGQKYGQDLISKYGGLDGVYANLPK
jgi:DNA polymerase-1